MKQWTLFKSCVLTALCVFTFSTAYAQDEAPAPVTQKEMFEYLDHSIAWYRQVASQNVSQDRSREIVLNSNLKSSAIKFLRQSFEFSRLQAGILETQEKEAAELKEKQVYTVKQQEEQQQDNLDNVKIIIAQKIERIQKDLADTQAQMRRARPQMRATLAAKHEKLTSELVLAQAQSDLVKTVSTASVKEVEDETLTTQINNLALSIPELQKKKKTTPATPPSDAATQTATQMTTPAPAEAPATAEEAPKESKGLIRLIGDILTLIRESQNIRDLAAQTTAMKDEHEAFLARLREDIMYIVHRGNELSEAASQNSQEFTAQAKELDTLTRRFKDLSAVIVPISEQKKYIEDSVQTLNDWQLIFSDEISSTFSRLIIHLVGLAIAIAIPVLLSEFSKRAILRYVHDDRRRRQLNIIRRIVLAVLIGFVVIINLMTEFGSLATFIGFVTAGLAVALQNVILSIVAYFFFFGRYGIRAGSRVSVYGTTGEVIETGLVRLYLMELEEEDGKWQPTGRIVAFPNSILFQPTAFYKQVPGAKFNQREMKIPLEKNTDAKSLNEKTREIDKAIYDDSRAVLEAQKIALEKSSRIKARIPKPKSTIVETENELWLLVRYPVPSSDKNARMDENVLRLVSEILERDPKVNRLNSDTPKAKPV